MFVHKTTLAIPQGNGVGYNTTSPFSGSRHYFGAILNSNTGRTGGGGEGGGTLSSVN